MKIKKDFSKNILNKIKKENIKQIPKYIFILKHIFIWLLFFLSIFIGALSLSISFEYLINADWYLVHRLGIIKIATIFMPFFWIIFLLLASFLSYYNFRYTEKGYKFSFFKVLFLNILFSLLLGVFLYFTGVNHFMEGKIEDIIPKYRSIFVEDKISRMIKVWQNEEEGLLLGKIIKANKNNLLFTDYNNKKWILILDKDSIIKGKVKMEVGEKIKIMGEKIDNNNFKVFQIRPFIGKQNKLNSI